MQGSPTRKVLTSRGNSLVDKVNDLIDPVTGTWDEMLIRDIFLDVDAERILKIPLSKHLTEDFVAWSVITRKYRGSRQSSRLVFHPNLLIRHKGNQRIFMGLSS